MAERPRPRFTIASEVGETQRQEAASKEDKMSVICGRAVGSPSQQFVVSSHISSDRPRSLLFGGREGRSPRETRPGTR